MRAKKNNKKAYLLLLVWLTYSAVTAAQVVVVNNSVAATQLSKRALKAIFGMRLTVWPGEDLPVTVFVLADDDPLHASFCKTNLTVFPHQLRRAWNRHIYSGTGQAPIQLDSVQEMRRRVAITPGAIGYLEADMIGEGMHVLPVK